MKAYRKREDGVVSVKLKIDQYYNQYLDKLGEPFCCSDGIYSETVEWSDDLCQDEPDVDGITDTEITFVISRLKPSDGICKEIWRDNLPDVSESAQEAYRAAAGGNTRAWYWVEH